MGRQHVRDEVLSLRQQKTGAQINIPVLPDLQTALNAMPVTDQLAFLTTEAGQPFTAAGFGGWFRERCDEAGLHHCTAHGLRKAAATRLANAGCSSEQIKAITGHRSASALAQYTRAADQQRLVRQALDTQLRAEGEQNLSNLPTRLDKTGSK
jgi:integrase